MKEGRIDVAILVTPLQEKGIKEYILFYEKLVAYVSKKNVLFKKNYLLSKGILIPANYGYWRKGIVSGSQIMNLCELQKAGKAGSYFEYEAGSIETLRRMVELNDGITILPELRNDGSQDITTAINTTI